MKFIVGTDRNQALLFPLSLESVIDYDNEVRLIDLFVDSIDLLDYGFKTSFKENGRPAYHPSDLLKLYIYGYMNKTRSSRDLEKNCKRNIEVMWLLKELQPDHNTISNFRRDNSKAIRKVFKATVSIAKHFELIGGNLIAGDSTKLRAQNSKKNNYNQKKIDRHLDYIDKKLQQYENELDSNDEHSQQIKQEVEQQQQRKLQYKQIEKQLKDSGEPQISTSDPDSRHMITRNNITEIAYNIQTTVDDKHNIPIDFKVTNTNDGKAMGHMLERASKILDHTNFTALYDKGYHTGSEFGIADQLGIDVMVAIPNVPNQAPDPKYNVANFNYDPNNDTYICPQGETLTTTGKWHSAKTYKFKRYTTKKCKDCPVKTKCTKAKYGKAIQRSEYQHLIEENKQRIENNKELYRKRQQIVEHPYGTIKRQWGFSYISTKKYIHRASAEVGLIFTCYNLRRIFNIVDKNMLKSYFKSRIHHSSKIIDFTPLKKNFLKTLYFITKTNPFKYKSSLNQLILA